MEAAAQPSRRLFTVAEYDRLGEAGVLTEDDRVELVEGEIIAMTPIGSRHAACVDRLTALLTQALVGRVIVRVQNPLRLDDRSEPEPDLCLLKPRGDYYAEAHPGPGDVLLVVEVADTTLDYDRKTKLPLYARAGLAEAWVVDLSAGRVEVCTEPREGFYARTTLHGRGETIVSTSVPGLAIPVLEILG